MDEELPRIRLAMRDWDYVTPLALGDLRPARFTLELDRVAALPEDFAAHPGYEASEISLSRYTLGRARGAPGIHGVPHFLMRGFRHRCIVTRRESRLSEIAALRGKRIGLAGWQDSGNTWTRAILRRAGIGIEDCHWLISRLLASHPITDRTGGYARPGLIEPVPGDTPLLEMLAQGTIDAVFMPFMPSGFFAPEAPFRPLLPDFRAAERVYYQACGYVPGIHLLGVKPAVAAAHPWLPAALSETIDQSYRMWMEKRLRYAETTPWLLDELRLVARDLAPDWDAVGLEANRRMLADFAAEVVAQGLAPTAPTPDELFPAHGGA